LPAPPSRTSSTGTGLLAHDVLRVAAEHRSGDTAPAVRADDDQVAAALAGFLDDRVGDAPAAEVVQRRLGGDALRASLFARLGEKALAELVQPARNFS
jgi:hypothetical protein